MRSILSCWVLTTRPMVDSKEIDYLKFVGKTLWRTFGARRKGSFQFLFLEFDYKFKCLVKKGEDYNIDDLEENNHKFQKIEK